MATHVFYAPHADDETLSMSAAILEKKREGATVCVVLLTDGASDETIYYLNGAYKCPIHDRYHNPHDEAYHDGVLSIRAFIDARIREFRTAVMSLGIPDEDISIYSYPDQYLPAEDMRKIVLGNEHNESLSQPVYHHTLSYKVDDHHDHLVAGSILLELYNQHQISTLPTWYIKRSMWNRVSPDMQIRDHTVDNDRERHIITKTCNSAYKRFKPDAGYYAIGYHSVHRSFDGILTDYTNKSHSIL